MTSQETENKDKLKSLPAGHTIAKRYEIIRKLGTGGMGAVYLAHDALLDHASVAIKVLHSDYLDDADLLQRFHREVQLMRKVKHRNVVQTYDVGQDQSLHYFTMEYVKGDSLEIIIQEERFARRKIPNLTIQVCEALEAIHAAGILHRDLKPGNIIILEDGTVRITDFGVARPEVSNLTAHNEILGSVCYIAPEIWLGEEPTTSIDLYSLGIVLYEVSTGEIPFDAGTPAELMRLHLDRAPVPPRDKNSAVPTWLNKLILQLLAKSPKDRPQSAREVVDYVKLRAVNSSNGSPGASDTSSSSDTEEFLEDLEQKAQNLTSSKSGIKTMGTNPTSVGGKKKLTSPSLSSKRKGTEIVTVDARSSFGSVVGEGLLRLAAAYVVSSVLLVAISSVMGVELLIKAGTTQSTLSSSLLSPNTLVQDVVSGFWPLALIFLYTICIPALSLGGIAFSWKTTRHICLCVFGFQFLTALSLLAYHLLPVLGSSSLTATSLISAGTVVKEQLLSMALLSPFSIGFSSSVVEGNLTLQPIGEIPLYRGGLLLTVSILYIILISFSIR